MRNYKALKAASKVSVRKQEAVDAVYNEDGSVKTPAVVEQLQLVSKRWDSATGESLDDSVTVYSLRDVSREIDRCKAEVSSIQAKQAELEQLEKDLKAL
jgi:anti-sigma factor ChrR (cupin superfamily)